MLPRMWSSHHHRQMHYQACRFCLQQRSGNSWVVRSLPSRCAAEREGLQCTPAAAALPVHMMPPSDSTWLGSLMTIIWDLCTFWRALGHLSPQAPSIPASQLRACRLKQCPCPILGRGAERPTVKATDLPAGPRTLCAVAPHAPSTSKAVGISFMMMMVCF